MQTVSVYRAVTGIYRPENNAYEGVTESDLERLGAFCENYSIAQARGGFGRLYNNPDDLNNLQYRKVKGLPVFLNQSEAEEFIGKERFIYNAAIVRVDVPQDLLFGAGSRIKLIQNFLDPSLKDKDLSEEDLQLHADGQRPIKGEMYMQGIFGGNVSKEVVEELKKHTTILRPRELREGKIELEKGYTETKLVPSPTEASQEISVK